MSDISNENRPIRVTGDLTPDQLAQLAEEREEKRRENSGYHIAPDTDIHPTKRSNREVGLTDTDPELVSESAIPEVSAPLAGEAATIAISAVGQTALKIPGNTLENAVEVDGEVLPDDRQADNDAEAGDDYDSYYEADYRELVGKDIEDKGDAELGDDETSVGLSGNKTFLPEGVGLVGAKEVGGEVLPDDDDSLNGSMAA
jgi:hypothetical protein